MSRIPRDHRHGIEEIHITTMVPRRLLDINAKQSRCRLPANLGLHLIREWRRIDPVAGELDVLVGMISGKHHTVFAHLGQGAQERRVGTDP